VTDWSKVLEVFLSGIIGVYLVMFLLQLMTQLSARVVDRIESWNRSQEPEQPPPAAKD
jgi:hypothetical protein